MTPLEKYKNTTASTSSTQNQLIFIFDEILKLLFSAKKAIGERDHKLKFRILSKIIEVLYTLKMGVNQDFTKESNQTIDVFYGSTIYQLENINIKGEEPEELQPIIDAISAIRQALMKEAA